MARKPINHPAFPINPYSGDGHTPPIRANSGMGIRDFFAAAALTGIVADFCIPTEAEDAARIAFEMADAMLLEREPNK